MDTEQKEQDAEWTHQVAVTAVKRFRELEDLQNDSHRRMVRNRLAWTVIALVIVLVVWRLAI